MSDAIADAENGVYERRARHLRRVQRWTTDVAQGREAKHVVLDTVCKINSFTFNLPRTIVAATHAQVSMTIVGDARAITRENGQKHRHPWKKVVNALKNVDNPQDGRIYEMNRERFARLPQFQNALLQILAVDD